MNVKFPCFTCVYPAMFLKLARRPELFEAGGALVVFDAGVDLSVKSQRIFSRKFF